MILAGIRRAFGIAAELAEVGRAVLAEAVQRVAKYPEYLSIEALEDENQTLRARVQVLESELLRLEDDRPYCECAECRSWERSRDA